MATYTSGPVMANPNQQTNNMFLPPGQTPLTTKPAWISGPNAAQTNNLQDYVFDEFQNLFGRYPTQSELDQFTNYYVSGDPNIANTSGGNQAIASYFNQQQQAAQAPQQEAQALQAQIPIINNLIQNQTAAATKGLTDPNNPVYQQFAGQFNNLGITPGSGAFNAGLGSTIGNAANQSLEAALGAVGLPLASTYSQGATQPFQQAMNQPGELFSNNLQIQDMLQQMMLAGNLAQQGAPSALQKDIGLASGAAQVLGTLGQAVGGAKTVTSYICKELIKRELLCELDMDDFHIHIMPAMFKKGRAFWKYAMDGYKLVQAVNTKGLNWEAFKPLLFDRVMQEPDPCKAVDLYADACHQLCISCDRSLWDEKVYRTSVWDSLRFLPLLFMYKPFLEAFWKCLRVKFLILYDKPQCEVHRGL